MLSRELHLCEILSKSMTDISVPFYFHFKALSFYFFDSREFVLFEDDFTSCSGWKGENIRFLKIVKI